jgi:hypothetical protein
MGEYALVFATVGTGLTGIAQALRAGGCDVKDTEESIKRGSDTKDAIQLVCGEAQPPFSMEDVTFYLTRLQVRELWKQHARQSIYDLMRGGHGPKVLTGHLVYYSARRREFYSAVANEVLATRAEGPSPSAVVLLIDDIYDAFLRLRAEDKLFSDDRARDFIGTICEGYHASAERLSLRQNARLTHAWKLTCLDCLLSWRAHEMVMAEHLAHHLNARFLVYPIKQSTQALIAWVRDRDVPAVYVSHPISEARRAQISSRRWPPFVQDVNSLQGRLLRKGIVAVLPASIDEMRFERTGLLRYTGRLTARWPLPGNDQSLLYALPGGSADAEHADLLAWEQYDVNARECKRVCEEERRKLGKPSIEGLVAKTTEQVSARDHLLVETTDGMLVYRPLYGKRKYFSSGVAAEFEHWAESGVRTPVAVVHFDEDVIGLLLALEKDEPHAVRAGVRDAVRRALAEELGVSDLRDANALIDEGRLPSRGVLGGRPRDAVERERRCPTVARGAVVKYLRNYLLNNCGDLPEDKVRVWVVRGHDALIRQLGAIASFLRGLQSPRETWRDRIGTLLPERLWKAGQ